MSTPGTPPNPWSVLVLPDWVLGLITTVAGGMGAAILALINRAPKFQQTIEASTRVLIEGQEARIKALTEHIFALERNIERQNMLLMKHEAHLISLGAKPDFD